MPSDNKPSDPGNLSRRSTLKTLLVGGGAVTLGALPAQWTRPVVDTVLLPAHAQTSELPVLNGFTVPSEVVAQASPGERDWVPALLNRMVPAAHASVAVVPAGKLCIERTETGWQASYNASGNVVVGSGNFNECAILDCGEDLLSPSIRINVVQQNTDGSFDFELYGTLFDCISALVSDTTNEACSLESCAT